MLVSANDSDEQKKKEFNSLLQLHLLSTAVGAKEFNKHLVGGLNRLERIGQQRRQVQEAKRFQEQFWHRLIRRRGGHVHRGRSLSAHQQP